MRAPNRRWVLARYPDGMPTPDNFRLEEVDVSAPGPFELVVRNRWLSVDPYMRGRISPSRNYANPVQPGEIMTAGGVGEVVESRHPAYASGDIVESFHMGWQEVSVVPGELCRKVDPAQAPIHSALSYLGMPGLTGLLGLTEIGRPRPGDTVLISAAAGAVGQVAGQVAKIMGCRAVALAGSEPKLAWCRELGYDVAIGHRRDDLEAAVREACPDGVDVFFDNTAGPIHDAVMANLAPFARVIVCGTVALAGRFGQPDIGPRHLRQILVTRATVRGFLIFDHRDRFAWGRARLAAWAQGGRLRHKEDVLDGIERMPEAFLRVLQGDNLGKQLVRLGDL